MKRPVVAASDAPRTVGESAADLLRDTFRLLADLAPVALWVTEADRIVYANRACAKLFGASSPAALQGRTMFTLLSPESHAIVRDGVARTLASGEPQTSLNEHILRLDGELREVEIAVSALPDHGRTTVQMVINDITERRRELRQAEATQRRLRHLSARLVLAREDERRHIARELHDELGQWLTALKMELTGLAQGPKPERLEERVAPLIEMVDETLRTVRRIATDLRPLMLDELGLNPAIEALARATEQRLGIGITSRLQELDPPLTADAAIALYRMVQEALTNVARHARARHARIELAADGDQLILTVSDDGVGFNGDAVQREGHHGLLGIDERAHMFGGRLEIAPRAEGGGRLTVKLPLAQVLRAAADGRRGVA